RDLPGDPGIAVAALAEVVDLARGEVLYLPPGGIHAYQEGLGVELMGPSDNVLRGGLTEKHVDVAEFLAVADFEPGPAPRIAPRPDGSGAAYVPEGSGLALRVRSGEVDEVLDLDGPAIALVVRGAFRVGGR